MSYSDVLILFSSLFRPFKITAKLTIYDDTSDIIGNEINAKFVDYKVSIISKTRLVDFELFIKNTLQTSDENTR
jgi:hypothetical protein